MVPEARHVAHVISVEVDAAAMVPRGGQLHPLGFHSGRSYYSSPTPTAPACCLACSSRIFCVLFSELFFWTFFYGALLTSFAHSPRASTKTGEHWPFNLVRKTKKGNRHTTPTDYDAVVTKSRHSTVLVSTAANHTGHVDKLDVGHFGVIVIPAD